MTSIPAGSQYLTPYMDPCQCQYAIGWGHALPLNNPGGPITPEEAQNLFNQDTSNAVSTLDSTVHVPLNQNQVDACSDYIYNAGSGAWEASGIPQALNAGDLNEAVERMRTTAGGCGLDAARRAKDAALLSGTGSLQPNGTFVEQ